MVGAAACASLLLLWRALQPQLCCAMPSVCTSALVLTSRAAHPTCHTCLAVTWIALSNSSIALAGELSSGAARLESWHCQLMPAPHAHLPSVQAQSLPREFKNK